MLAFALAVAACADAPLPLKDGDKVVLLGSTLFERASNYGYWEAAALARHPGMRLAFRNYAWSGDTVRCQARSYFGPPQEGFARLKANLEREKPTAAVLCYGANESAAGPEGIPAFVADYKRLVEMVKAASPGVRLLLVSHPPRPGGPPPIPDQTAINKNIALYNAASEKLAKEMGLPYADFGEAVSEAFELPNTLKVEIARHRQNNILLADKEFDQLVQSDDGVTYSEYGYLITSEAFAGLFLGEPIAWLRPAALRYGSNTQLVDPNLIRRGDSRDGKWQIRNPSGKVVARIARDRTSSEGWHKDADDRLRQAILKKEHLVFNRWRPQNETYLFGFRKHEQGNNGVEIPQFDPLIAKADDEIAMLMKEPPYRLEPITEASK